LAWREAQMEFTPVDQGPAFAAKERVDFADLNSLALDMINAGRESCHYPRSL